MITPKVYCEKRHLCKLTKQIEKDSDNNDITEFTCSKCDKKGKCKTGRYVCA